MRTEKIEQAIKLAAKSLFRKYGYNKTTVNDIAKKSKIAKATIYKYFESKELILHAITMEYIQQSLHELMRKPFEEKTEKAYLADLILKTSRISYTVCNEFIGWEFIRESLNAQEFLKALSDDLEELLIQLFKETIPFKDNNYANGLRFLIKSSKSIVFSFAFTSVSESDVRKNFVSFQNDILPYLVKGAVGD